MSPFFLWITIVALLGFQVAQTFQAKVDCRKVVFHPSCRGISAKRSNLQIENSVNLIPTTDSGKQRQLVDPIDYSELEREDTPELDLNTNRRRGINHRQPPLPASLPPTPSPALSSSFVPPSSSSSFIPSKPPTHRRHYPTFTQARNAPSSSTTSSPSVRRDNPQWNHSPGIIPPRHSTFFMGQRRPMPELFKPRHFKHPYLPFATNKIFWMNEHRSEEHFSNQL